MGGHHALDADVDTPACGVLYNVCAGASRGRQAPGAGMIWQKTTLRLPAIEIAPDRPAADRPPARTGPAASTRGERAEPRRWTPGGTPVRRTSVACRGAARQSRACLPSDNSCLHPQAPVGGARRRQGLRRGCRREASGAAVSLRAENQVRIIQAPKGLPCPARGLMKMKIVR